MAKRYYTEAGTDAGNALFSASPPLIMGTTYIGYAETASILRGKFNSSLLNPVAFRLSRLSLEMEALLGLNFCLVAMEDSDFLAGISPSDQHNLNTSDPAILPAFLRYAQAQPSTAPACALVAADSRLLCAASAEGLHVLNPELVPVDDVPALLRRI